jgi:hypothetical protein
MTPLYWHDETKASALEGCRQIDTWAAAANDKSDHKATFDLVADLKKLSAPALTVEGKDDLIAPYFVQEGLKTNIPHSVCVPLIDRVTPTGNSRPA